MTTPTIKNIIKNYSRNEGFHFAKEKLGYNLAFRSPKSIHMKHLDASAAFQIRPELISCFTQTVDEARFLHLLFPSDSP